MAGRPHSHPTYNLAVTTIDQLRIAARSVNYGDRIRDKVAIAFLLGLYPLHPIGSFARRLRVGLPDPARLVKSYRCRSADGIFICPGGGPNFLACDPTYDPGVGPVIDRLTEGTFLDIGANLGFFTVRAAKRLGPRGHVVAVEPHPGRFGLLNSNIALNGLLNVTCLPYAAGRENGRATIFEPDHSFGPHRLDVSCTAISDAAIEVEMRTIDTMLNSIKAPPLALVKIDVEGSEAGVIDGMRQTLEESGAPVIFEALNAEALSLSTDSLRRLRYSVSQIDANNYLALRSPGTV